MMKVIWTVPARRDLELIAEYLMQNQSATEAGRILGIIRDRTKDLGKFPNKGRAGRIEGTRELVILGTPFIAPYRVRDENVEILTVFHGSRQWPESL